MDKHVVVISREWNKPSIKISVTDKDISIEMSLSDFINAVVEEAGNPTLLFTNNGLRARLVSAAQEVCNKMKQSTAAVM